MGWTGNFLIFLNLTPVRIHPSTGYEFFITRLCAFSEGAAKKQLNGRFKLSLFKKNSAAWQPSLS
jgi:hypothetical protein